MYNKGKGKKKFLIYGPQYKKIAFLAIRGGAWVAQNYPLTYINLHIKYESNPIRIL